MKEEREKKRIDGCSGGLPTILPLFTGFCGAIGLLVMVDLRIPLPFVLVFIALAAIGLL